MGNNNKKKAFQLRMPYGTASNRLKKLLLFRFVVETGQDICCICSTRILTVEDLSIEHRIPWLDSDNPVELFFDLNNISYAHLSCNVSRGKRPDKREGKFGTAWCYKCNRYLPREEFSKNRSRWNGLQNLCDLCRKTIR